MGLGGSGPERFVPWWPGSGASPFSVYAFGCNQKGQPRLLLEIRMSWF